MTAKERRIMEETLNPSAWETSVLNMTCKGNAWTKEMAKEAMNRKESDQDKIWGAYKTSYMAGFTKAQGMMEKANATRIFTIFLLTEELEELKENRRRYVATMAHRLMKLGFKQSEAWRSAWKLEKRG